MFPREVRPLLAAFFLISLGGLILHLRIHPVEESVLFWVAPAFGALNAFVLPLLLGRSATAGLGVLLTMTTVGAGTIGMAWFSAVTWTGPAGIADVVFKSTFPDILILAAKAPLALTILRLHGKIAPPEGPEGPAGRGCAA